MEPKLCSKCGEELTVKNTYWSDSHCDDCVECEEDYDEEELDDDC